MDSELYNSIIKAYLDTQSVKTVSSTLSVSQVKVRKVLITEGLWTSRTSKQIADMLAEGLTTAQIAAQLCTTEKAVQQYLPYSRGLYGGDRTRDATRSLEYRQRIAIARERVVRPRSVREAINNLDYRVEQEKNERSKSMNIMRLHMELVDEFNELDKNAGIEYGSTITRDILVPADIQLWALHYAIQASFGWQNSHLHNFELTEEQFKEITDDKCGKWATLVGGLFRVPEGLETNERHLWADDYEDGSFKTWLRRKYTGPYESRDEGEEEHYIKEAVMHLLPQVEGVYKVQYRKNADDAVYPADCIKIFPDGKEKQLNFSWVDKEPIVDTKVLPWQNLPICFLHCFFESSFDYVLERFSVGEVLASASEMDETGAHSSSHSVRVDELIYRYDYGDDWMVRIGVGDWNCEDLIRTGRLTAEELEEARKMVEGKYRPVMVGADGFNAIDDAGGMHGLGEFYRCVNGGKNGGMYDNKAEAVAWARSLGWSKRRISLKNRL